MIRINGVDRESQVHVQSEIEHGMYHMTANKKLFEPQRSSDFEFYVTDLSGIAKVGDNRTYGDDVQEMLRLAVVSCPIPHFSIEPLVERRGNSVQKFAGLPTFPEGQLTVRDWIGVDTKSMLMSWQHCAYDVYTDKVGTLSDYKKDCYLVEYTPDRQKVRQWILYGCWVSEISEDPFNHETSTARSITATIHYDKAVMDVRDID